MQEMRLSQADAAVKEQRIVRSTGCLGDGQRRRVREGVVVADNESFECVPGIEWEFARERIIPMRFFLRGCLRAFRGRMFYFLRAADDKFDAQCFTGALG